MLGRLEMDVQQCIDAYRKLSDQAFKRRRHIYLLASEARFVKDLIARS